MARARLVAMARDADRVAHEVRRREGRAAEHLPRLPADADGWARAAGEAAARGGPGRADLAGALALRQGVLDAGPKAVAAARRLADPAVAVVVTGQQPGLYGGPLLTLHKAAGALHLARSIEAMTGRPVVPVFWLASEDHDLEEANQLTVLDAAGQPRRLVLDVRGDGRSLADLKVLASASDALGTELEALLARTPRARDALALLARRDGEPFASWSARCLLRALGDSGLVLIEPRVLLPWLGAELAALVRQGRAIQDAVRAEGARLVADGLPAPLAPASGDLPLFERLVPTGPRLRLGLDGAGEPLRAGLPRGGTLEDLARHLALEPALGSPDVTGRVFVQNALLPVLAYVAGPTELAYLAQVGAAHRALGRAFPLAVPRPSACWLDARTEETALSFGRTLEEVLAAPASTPAPPSVPADAFVARVRALLEQQRRGAAEVVGLGPQGAAALASALDRLQAEWARSEAPLRAASAADQGLDAARWARLQNLLFPRGKPQERSLSILGLLARYGHDAVRAGLVELDPLADGFWVLRGDVTSHA